MLSITARFAPVASHLAKTLILTQANRGMHVINPLAMTWLRYKKAIITLPIMNTSFNKLFPAPKSRFFSSTQQATNLFYRILSIDGGGIRGIIPGKVLEYMEKYTGRPLHFLFDGITGTSTGGILGLSSSAPSVAGSNKNRFSATETLSVYTDPSISKKIFSEDPPQSSNKIGNQPKFKIVSISIGSGDTNPVIDTDLPGIRKFFRTQYSAKNLESILQERFGNLEIKDMLTDILITSVDINTRVPKLFTRAQAQENSKENYPIWKVARSTSAAPTFFDPFALNELRLVDGGMVANNPTLCMIIDAQRRGIPISNMICMSLGTGEYITPLNTHGYGQLQFAPMLFDVMSSASSELVHHQAKELLKDRYHRFQIRLSKYISLDDMTDDTTKELQKIGDGIIQINKGKIEKLCDTLKEIGEKKISRIPGFK